jgi:hypothetical protein
MILITPWLHVNGMALWPFILVKYPQPGKVLINHERIHLRQQVELLILPFYIWYAGEYLYRLWQHGNHYLAYLNISFEREAFANEKELDYLAQRSAYSFLKYRPIYKKPS